MTEQLRTVNLRLFAVVTTAERLGDLGDRRRVHRGVRVHQHPRPQPGSRDRRLNVLGLVLIIGSFANLVVIDVFLNMLYSLLIFVAAMRLRQKEPRLERAFRIRGNAAVLAAICAPAIFIALLTLHTNANDASTTEFGHASFSIFGFTIGWYGIGGLIGLVSGPVAYLIFKRTLGGRPLESEMAAEPADVA